MERLWATVKDTKRREGITIAEQGKTLSKSVLVALSNNDNNNRELVIPGSKDNVASVVDGAHDDLEPPKREASEPVLAPTDATSSRQLRIEELESQLKTIEDNRESRRKESEVLLLRHKLLNLAIERADRKGECGWDQRLCFGDEEWREFGEGVLESYDAPVASESTRMDVDGEETEEAEWWCRGKKKCERHAGWQKIRERELYNEKEEEAETHQMLDRKEQDIRSRINELKNPGSSAIKLDSVTEVKAVVNGDGSVKGPSKKKKKSGK